MTDTPEQGTTPQSNDKNPVGDEADLKKFLELKEKLGKRGLSASEVVVLSSLQKSEASQRREEQLSRRTFTTQLIMGFMLVFVIVFFIWHSKNQDNIIATTIHEFTYIGHEFQMVDLGVVAQKEVFRKQMMRLFSIYGKRYDRKEVVAMSKEQKPRVIELCFGLTLDIKRWGGDVEYHDAVTTGILESALNPNQDGPAGEKGWLQFKWATAWTAYGMYKSMPDWFQKKYRVELKKHSDMYNPYTSTILYYVYKANLQKYYRGSEMWAMSEYHWGLGYLGNSYQNGKGDLPAFVTIQGKEYCIPAYYMNWISLKESFKAGKVQEGKEFHTKWQARQRVILKEEITLNNSAKIIKKLRNEKNDIRALLKEVTERVEKFDKKEQEAYTKFLKIYSSVQDGSFTSIRKKMNEHIPIIKKWMKQYREAHETEQRWLMAAAVAILIFFLLMVYFLLRWSFLWLRHKKYLKQVPK